MYENMNKSENRYCKYMIIFKFTDIYVHIGIHNIFIHMYVYDAHVCACVCIFGFVYDCACVRVCVFLCVYVYVFLCVRSCVFVCL